MINYLSVDMVAEVLHLSRSSAYALFRRKDFPTVSVGHRLYVAEPELQKWLENGGTNGEPLTRPK